jgi:hypothetical protein
MLLEDMEIISAFFAGSVIREGFGKLSTIFPLRLAIKKAGPWLTLQRPPVIIVDEFFPNFLFHPLYNPCQVSLALMGSHGAHDASRLGVPQTTIRGPGVVPAGAGLHLRICGADSPAQTQRHHTLVPGVSANLKGIKPPGY